jgi:hypothetical protein
VSHYCSIAHIRELIWGICGILAGETICELPPSHWKWWGVCLAMILVARFACWCVTPAVIGRGGSQ